MPLHTDSAPPAHFRVRVAGHGGLTARRYARPPRTRPQTTNTTMVMAVPMNTTMTTSGTTNATNTTTENG
ncbi:hypothetical protein [Streptomyces sp. NPDC058401]|uniref:hypothetical protein n=1 Tax=Streptomyces sp. NPDC058401 TaxID=3346480 RepID=UPI003648016D